MKLRYYSYWLKNIQTGEEFSFDLQAILKAFCNLANNDYRNSFSYDSERVFLKPHVENTLILFTTRDRALIRKLDTQSYSDSDIRDLLEKAESLVFPSYVHLESGYLAFAATNLAARSNAFFDFVNDILRSMNCKNLEAKFSPIMTETSFEEAVDMPFVGRTHVSISTENRLAQEILRAIGKDLPREQIAALDGIDLILRPRFRQNINGAAAGLLTKARGAGLQKAHFKGKSRWDQDRQIEMYLETQGAVFDSIRADGTKSINDQIKEKIKDNDQLREQLEKLNGTYKQKPISSQVITDLYSSTSWTDRLRDV